MQIRRRAAVASAAVLSSLGLAMVTAAPANAISGGVGTTWGRFYCSYAYNTAVKTSSLGDTRDTLHYRCSVTDRARDGYAVYMQYKGWRRFMADTAWYRLTPNVSPAGTTRTYSGTVVANTLSGWQLRVCKSIPNRSDICSTYITVPD